jgi:glycosyltransferase involved in cell wall biosynthesis
MIILLPAFEPTHRLIDVITGLRSAAPWHTIVVVDDGSGPTFEHVFDDARVAGAKVLGYPRNHGKGFALKTGFRYIHSRWPGSDVVCADSDGQHSTTDILRVADAVDGAIVLGGRRFAGEVPARSRFGNAVTRTAFRLASGVAVHDTQTGLRGYPAAMLPWLLGVPGDRFEYELSLLLRARAAGHDIEELEIETIYLEQNASSHFRPVIDSLRVFTPLVKFGASSLAAFAIDAFALWALFALTDSLLVSVVGARVLSATINFFVNRKLVFRSADATSTRRAALRYLVLALALLASSYAWLATLTSLGVALVIAKPLTDVSLYVLSFAAQKSFVFGSARPRSRERARVLTSR